MSKITIVDLEVMYCVGVTDEERAKPQRLLLTVDMNFDFTSAAVSDRIERTIDYQTVANDMLKFGEGRSWRLIERVVAKIAEHDPDRIQAGGGDGGDQEVFHPAGPLCLREHGQDPHTTLTRSDPELGAARRTTRSISRGRR